MSDFVFPPAPQPWLAIAGSALRFPLRRVWCVGRNYLAHAREMGSDEREPPFFFSKQADMAATGATIAYPSLTHDLHHEVELVVALKAGGHDIAPGQAMACVFGYAVGVDLTRRDQQNTVKAKGKPWEIAKSFDASGPCGALTAAAEAGDIAKAAIRLSVNGAVRQSSDIGKLIWSIPEVIAQLSRQVSLAAGDIIFTGTPDGVGPLVPGDRLEARIDGLEPLTLVIA